MSKKKILLVDDQEGFCRIIKVNLEETGKYEVRTESKSTNAVASACEFKPDLILLDFIMPDMDGCQVREQLKNDDKTKNIPVIFLTSLVSKAEAQDKVFGENYVLGKPVSSDELIEGIEERLKERG